MPSVIKPRRTMTPGAVPTTANLADGEMCFNIPDKRIYIRNGGTIYTMTIGFSGIYGEDGVQVVADGANIALSVAPEYRTVYESGTIQSLSTLTWGNNTILYKDNSGVITTSAVTQTGLNVLTIPPVADTVHYTLNSGGAAAIYTVTSWFRGFSASASAAAARTALGIVAPSLDYITGFIIQTTATSIIIGAGECTIPSTGTVVASAGNTISSTRTTNTTYHLYINSAGTITRSTTAPSAVVSGAAFARSMTGDTTQRYLGSVRTAPSGTANYLLQSSNGGGNQQEVHFHYNSGFPINTASTGGGRIIAGGTHPTTATDVSAATLAPANTTNYLMMVIRNINTLGSTVRYFSWAPGTGFQSTVPTGNVPSMGSLALNLRCDFTPKIQYDVPAGSPDTAYIDCVGYGYLR